MRVQALPQRLALSPGRGKPITKGLLDCTCPLCSLTHRQAALLLLSSPDSSGKAFKILPNLSPILIHFISLYRANTMMRERKHLKTVKAYVDVKVVAVTEALAQFQLLKKREPSFFPALGSLAELCAHCLCLWSRRCARRSWRESKKSLESLYLSFYLFKFLFFFLAILYHITEFNMYTI